MELTKKKQLFLQMQFSLLLLVLALIPSFSLFPTFNIPAAICEIAGLVGVVHALIVFYMSEKELPLHYVIIVGVGVLLSLLDFVPMIPGWLNILAIILFLVAFFLGKNCLQITWSQPVAPFLAVILFAGLLRVYDAVGDMVATSILSLVGAILFMVGVLKCLKLDWDEKMKKGFGLLKTAMIINMIVVVLSWPVGLIPLAGDILISLFWMGVFIVEIMAYNNMKKSESLGENARSGFSLLTVSVILFMVGSFFNMIPVIDMLYPYVYIPGILLVYLGWKKILMALEQPE